MTSPFERVYTISQWYDGPRTGAADFRGAPHHFRSLYLDTPDWDPHEDRFELTPLTATALEWIVQADALYQRWDTARRRGALPPAAREDALPEDAPLVFPEDRERYETLERQLAAYLTANRERAFVVHGAFASRSLGVHWSDPLPAA